MSEEISQPNATRRLKHFRVEIKYDDPYPKTHIEPAMAARTHGRAIHFAYRAFKKTRPGKREPKVVNIKSVVF